jgi:hypothetical protein
LSLLVLRIIVCDLVDYTSFSSFFFIGIVISYLICDTSFFLVLRVIVLNHTGLFNRLFIFLDTVVLARLIYEEVLLVFRLDALLDTILLARFNLGIKEILFNRLNAGLD